MNNSKNWPIRFWSLNTSRALSLLASLSIAFVGSSAQAFYMELGFSYSYQKRTIDTLNGHQSQGTTGSLSLYFWEKLAIELSYTSGLFVKKEREFSLTSSSVQRETSQASEIYETNFIYLITEKRVRFQPYLKAGAAHIKKKQSVFVDGTELYQVIPKSAVGPSYGIGAKYFFTEEVALRMSYDVVRTPVDESTSTEDSSVRVGFSWVL